MADVSVEFGAKDTGLENALKTVQDELTRLDEKVKGGELSFNELESSMKRIAQVEKLQGQLEGMAQATGDAGNAAGTAAPKVDEIGKQTKQAGKEAEGFGEKSEGGFLKMSGAVAAGQLAAEVAMAGIRAAINLAKGAIDEFGAALDLGGRLSDLAARTGEAEGNLLLLERAFTNTGASAEQVGPVINKLQKFMEDAAAGGSTQTAAMERLGVSYEELAGKTPTQQLEILAQRISAIEDPGQRAAAAMGVFGEEGAQLIPLLTNFSGSIGTAKSQLGGMVEIMNTNAATFNEVGKKIDGIKGKFMEFAAGILDRIVPALDAITEGLSRIDAAALGQKLADAFLGGTQAMQGFQSAVDAFKIGEFGKAFELIFESIKLQLMQTGNAIITNFTAAFKTVGDVMAQIFRSDGPGIMLIKQTFTMISGFISEKLYIALADFMGAIGRLEMEKTFRYKAETAAKSVSYALESIGTTAELVAEDAGSALGGATESFKKNLTESESKFFDIGEQSATVKGLQDEITGAVANTNKEKQNGIDMAPVEQGNVAALLAEEQKRLQNELDIAKAKGDAAEKTFAQIENEIELNNAIATGNEEEIKRVQEKQKAADIAEQIKENEESLPAIIQDIIDKTGTSAETAEDLAEQLVASKNAALGVATDTGQVKTNLGDAGAEAQTVKGLMDEIANAKMEASPERLKERTIDARKELKEMRDFIGEDLSKMPLDNIIDKLGLDPEGKLKTADEKLRAVEGAIKDIGGADPADITPDVDLVGVNDQLEKVKGYLAGIEKDKADATPQIDQESVKQQASTARKTVEDDLKKVEATVTVKPKLDKEALKEEVDMAFASSKGTQYLGDIKGFVEVIKGFVEKIEGKLPLQALAY